MNSFLAPLLFLFHQAEIKANQHLNLPSPQVLEHPAGVKENSRHLLLLNSLKATLHISTSLLPISPQRLSWGKHDSKCHVPVCRCTHLDSGHQLWNPTPLSREGTSSHPVFICMHARCSMGKQPTVHTTYSPEFALEGKPMLVLPAWSAFVCFFPKCGLTDLLALDTS